MCVWVHVCVRVWVRVWVRVRVHVCVAERVRKKMNWELFNEESDTEQKKRENNKNL